MEQAPGGRVAGISQLLGEALDPDLDRSRGPVEAGFQAPEPAQESPDPTKQRAHIPAGLKPVSRPSRRTHPEAQGPRGVLPKLPEKHFKKSPHGLHVAVGEEGSQERCKFPVRGILVPVGEAQGVSGEILRPVLKEERVQRRSKPDFPFVQPDVSLGGHEADTIGPFPPNPYFVVFLYDFSFLFTLKFVAAGHEFYPNRFMRKLMRSSENCSMYIR